MKETRNSPLFQKMSRKFILKMVCLGHSAVGRESPPQVADQPLTGEAVTLEAASNPQTKQVR